MRQIPFYLFLIFSIFSISGINVHAQSRKETNRLIRETVITKTNVTLLKNLEKRKHQQFTEEKNYALELAKKNGWPTQMEKDGRFIELMKVDKDGNPIYYTTYNSNAAISTRAATLHNGGLLGLNLEGQGMTAHVWDAGLARSTHQEYDGVGGTDRFSIGDNSTALHFHSAHVTGTIIASGVKTEAKGMAPQGYAVGYDWNADIAEVADAAANGMLLSNHSYGWQASSLADWVFGAYIADSRDWDEVLYNAPYYLMCVAAGNDGDDNTSNGAPLGSNPNYDKLSGHATAKNNLVVANGREIAIDANGDFVSMSINTSSSEGPTDDYRIKPDITGNGTNIYSTVETSNSAYNALTGTSMAAPNVAGSLLLLQQYYSQLHSGFMKAATLKGLALHTADDAGPAGPDAVYGWGLMNAKKAALIIENNFDGTIMSELTLNDGEIYTIDVFANGIEDLTASVSWTDVPGIPNEGTANDNTPALVNDLDIRVTENTNTFYPFRLTSLATSDNGDNVVDPYEKIIVTSPATATRYTITVSHKGTLASAQDFSLIISGIENSSPNSLTATSNNPNQINLDWNKNSSNDNVLIAWSTDGNFGNPADQTSYNVGDAISGGGTVLYNGGQTSFTHGSLSENTTYYYKMWSVLPSGDYSAGIYAHGTTIKSAPSAYPTNFTAGSPSGTTIPLTWTDATGSVVPDGYLIKGSYISFEDIIAPTNGAPENDSRLVKNSIAGTESKIMDSLMGETNYYFKIYPFTNSGANIIYKTDATAPQASATTDVDPCAGITLPYSENFDSGDNCWNGVTGNGNWVNTTPTVPPSDHTGGGTCFVTNGNNDYATNAIYNLISPKISLYGFNNCELTFWIYMNAEPSSGTDYWDGGFIEVWDGTKWTQVTTSLPYDGPLHAGNPLGGNEAWAPASIRDWTQVTVDLSAYDENPDFQFRIRFGSDGAAVASGWAIDDVSITGTETCTPPQDQAIDFTVLGSTYNSLNIGWTRATPYGGDNVLVVAKTAAVAHIDPTKGNSYTANSEFAAGSEIGEGNFVVYDGTGTNVNITNLDNLSDYEFSIYEYRLSDFCYNLIELNGNAITEAKPDASNHVTDFSTGVPTPNEIPLTWTDATGTIEPDGYLILANTTGTFLNPTNSIPVENDTDFSNGSGAVNIEQGQQAYTFTNLDFDTQYYFKIFPYTNTGSFIIYKTDGTVPTDNTSTLIDPCSIDITAFPYTTDFSDITTPQCWDVLDNEGSGQVWQFGTISAITFGNGNYAYLDSDGYGLANDQNSDLVTHTFNFSSYEDVTLSFDHYYKHVGESLATLSYSIDNGTTWTQIQQWTASTDNPEAFSQVLNELDGQSQVKFKFNYIGGFSWYWCVDNLQVDATMICTPPSNQAVDFNSPSQTTATVDIEWTRGTPDGGDEVIVLAKKASAVDAIPASGNLYNAHATYGSGSEIGIGNYVVYAGSGNNVTIDNLNGNTTYHFAIYEYDVATLCYLTPGLTGNATTLAKEEPTNNATELAIGTTTATDMQITWTDATGGNLPDGYLLMANTTGTFSNPTDTNPQADNSNLSDGSAVINVPQGVESYMFTDLNYATQYFFKLYAYSNSGSLIDFKTDGTIPETNGITNTDPCVVDLSITDYTEDFENVTTPALPTCTSIEDANNDAYKWGTSSDYPNSGSSHLSIQYNGSAAMNDWFFSQPLQLKAGHEYELRFWYRARSSSYPEKLKVKLGTSNSSSAMTIDQLFDNNNIINETYVEEQQTFSATTDGIYYLGWQGYSDANMWYLYVDDISVIDLGIGNNAPVVENPISDITETEGFVSTTIDIANVFTDADNDVLTFSVSSDATNVATASLSGTTLTITEAGIGTANITVTANDGNGGSANDVFEFNINSLGNNAPVVENPISDITETEGFVYTTIDITNVFTDADNDVLTFSVSSDATNVATASLSGTTLTLTEAGIGTANITVTANDGNGGSANDVFEFIIEDDNSVANFRRRGINVYPNPAEDYIIIEFEQANETPVKYELFATSGERIAQGIINNHNKAFQIDLSGYQSGLYFLKLINGNIYSSFKISLK